MSGRSSSNAALTSTRATRLRAGARPARPSTTSRTFTSGFAWGRARSTWIRAPFFRRALHRLRYPRRPHPHPHPHPHRLRARHRVLHRHRHPLLRRPPRPHRLQHRLPPPSRSRCPSLRPSLGRRLCRNLWPILCRPLRRLSRLPRTRVGQPRSATPRAVATTLRARRPARARAASPRDPPRGRQRARSRLRAPGRMLLASRSERGQRSPHVGARERRPVPTPLSIATRCDPMCLPRRIESWLPAGGRAPRGVWPAVLRPGGGRPRRWLRWVSSAC